MHGHTKDILARVSEGSLTITIPLPSLCAPHADTSPPLPVHPHNHTPVLCVCLHLQQTSSVTATLTAGRCATTDRVAHNRSSFLCSDLAHTTQSECKVNSTSISQYIDLLYFEVDSCFSLLISHLVKLTPLLLKRTHTLHTTIHALQDTPVNTTQQEKGA